MHYVALNIFYNCGNALEQNTPPLQKTDTINMLFIADF